MGSRNGSGPRIPQAMGTREKAKMVFDLLHGLQQDRHRIDLHQVSMGHEDDDHTGLMRPPKGDGAPTPITYTERRAEIDRSIEKLCSKYAHLMPTVEKLAEQYERDAEAEAERVARLSVSDRAVEMAEHKRQMAAEQVTFG